MQNQTNLSTPGRRGGARPGAGRKRLPHKKTLAGFMLDQETRAIIEAWAAREGISLSAALRQMVAIAARKRDT